MGLCNERLRHLKEVYEQELLSSVLPFWLNHAVDEEQGGFFAGIDRDGTVIDTDKGMWQQGRFTWVMGHLYNTVEPRQEWLDAARQGIEFIQEYGFDPADGRMWFHVTREGRPIRKRRYAFSEAFAAMAFAEYAQATGDETLAAEARRGA